jgi:hypothetical protein
MRNLLRATTGALITAFVLVGINANWPPVQDKAMAATAAKGKATVTVLGENDKVLVQEVHLKAGDVNESPSPNMRVVRALKGGTITRTFADGTTDKVEWKTGQVRIQPAGQKYTSKNSGKSEIVLYVVVLK